MTTDTPIQFPDDDRTLLRRLFGLVQSIDARVQSIDDRLTKLETKVDERLHDTRPMWEEMKQRLDRFEQSVSEIKRDLRSIDRRWSELNLEVAETVYRVHKLEEGQAKQQE